MMWTSHVSPNRHDLRDLALSYGNKCLFSGLLYRRMFSVNYDAIFAHETLLIAGLSWTELKSRFYYRTGLFVASRNK